MAHIPHIIARAKPSRKLHRRPLHDEAKGGGGGQRGRVGEWGGGEEDEVTLMDRLLKMKSMLDAALIEKKNAEETLEMQAKLMSALRLSLKEHEFER
jgi:hypothetical protein